MALRLIAVSVLSALVVEATLSVSYSQDRSPFGDSAVYGSPNSSSRLSPRKDNHGVTTSDRWNGFRAEVDAYAQCNLRSARQLALEPADPAALAMTARRRCAKEEKELAEAMRITLGVGKALTLWEHFRNTTLESNLSSVIEWRATDNLETKCNREKNSDLAIQACTNLLDKHPLHAFASISRGIHYHDKEQFDKSIADFSRAIQLKPKYAIAYRLRSISYLELKRYDEGIADLTAVLNLDSMTSNDFVSRGLAYYEKGESRLAILDFDQALALDRRNVAAFFRRGFMYYELDKNDLAIGDFTSAISIDRAYIQAYVFRGMAHDKRGEKTQAINDFQTVLRQPPKGPNDNEMIDLAKVALASLSESGNNLLPSITAGTVSIGSGFFISKVGHVLTNAHAVNNCQSVNIAQPSSRARPARLIARDSSNDLALLKADETPIIIPKLRVNVRTGESIAAYGFPMADVLPSSGNFTMGNVTAIAGMGDDTRMLQISAPIQAGNSGGPLMDGAGNVAGVVTSKLDAHQGNLAQNVNFAIKSSIVIAFLEAHGLDVLTAVSAEAPLSHSDLAQTAKLFTVIITCAR